MANLSRGAVQQMFAGRSDITPTLQVIDIRKIPSNPQVQGERWRLILSDSERYMQGMLTSQLNNLITSQQLKLYSVLRLDSFVVNNVSGKKIIIALKLAIVSPPTGSEIGSPSSIEDPVPNGQPQARPQQPQQSYNQYRQPQQSSSAAQQNGFGRGGRYMSPGQRGGPINPQMVVPVASLNPFRGRWTIKVRCTAKSAVRHWQNQNGEGKVFSVDLLDKDGCEIRATMFKEAVDKFEDVFQVDKVYLISGGRVKTANKRFTAIKNDYEITLDPMAQVEPVNEDQEIKHQTYDFLNIADIQNLGENTYVDVIAIVKNVEQMTQVTSRSTNKQLDKRNITLADRSGTIELTLWSESAEKWNEETLKNFPVVAIKAARVTEFGGRSLSLSQNSSMEANPDRDEAFKLKSWWDSDGAGADLPSLSTGGRSAAITDSDLWIKLADVGARQLGRSQNGKADVFVTKATITNMRYDITRPPYYMACTNQREGRQCNKKVTPKGDQWWCETCNREFPTCEPRYVLNFAINDHTGSEFVGAFNEHGEKILGIPAEQMRTIVDSGDDNAFSAACDEAQFQTKNMKIAAKVQTYNDEERVRLTIIGLEDVDYVKESGKLINDINGLP